MDKHYASLARWLTNSRKSDEKDYEIYKFGFQAAFEQGLFVITCLIIALFLRLLGLMLLFLVVFHLIRPYIGGFHFKKFVYCYLFSVVSATGIALLSKVLFISIDFAFSSTIVLCGIAYIILISQTPNMKFKEGIYYKKKLRRNLIIIVFFSLVVYMLNIPTALVTITFTMILTIISFLITIIKKTMSDKKN